MGQKFGQHFLKNTGAIEKIVAALELKKGDTVIEIGPGHGEMTGSLVHGAWCMDAESKIILIEKDAVLAEELKNKFSENKNIEVIEGDALKILPELTQSSKLKAKSYKLVGNIPYYITGHLLRKISELKNKPNISVLMIQKEVAERIVAVPPDMNRLAASVQFWAEPKILMRLPASDFSPPPEVESAVIRLQVAGGLPSLKLGRASRLQEDAEKYYETVRGVFAQPRKTILNNLAEMDRHSKPSHQSKSSRHSGKKHAKQGKSQDTIKLPQTKENISEFLLKIGISPESRPQNLSIDQILDLVRIFYP